MSSSVPLCTHVMASGSTCGSPAVSGTALCYHHSAVKTALGKVVPLDKVPYGAHSHIPFVFPEDRASLQINFFLLLQAFNEKRIDQRVATVMHRMLRAMSANLGAKPLAEDRAEPQPSPAISVNVEPSQERIPDQTHKQPQPNPARAVQEQTLNMPQEPSLPPSSQNSIEPSAVFSVDPPPNAAAYPSNRTAGQHMGALSPEGQRILAMYNNNRS